MSQTSIKSYFSMRKRPASDEIREKNKVLVLEKNQTLTAVHKTYPAEDPESPSSTLSAIPEDKTVKIEQYPAVVSNAPKLHTVVRNIQFDSPKRKSPKGQKRAYRISVEDGQADIRETFRKRLCTEESRNPFEKKGSLIPKKAENKLNQTMPKKVENVEENVEYNINPTTPKKNPDVPNLLKKDLSLIQIKNILMKSNRLNEMRARINKISQLDKKLVNFGSKENEKKVESNNPEIKQFNNIELAISTSMESAYKRFADLGTSKKQFALPGSYRLLAEIFRCIDTVTAIFYNRNETITYAKLKPSVQEMLHRNLTLDHLAQIKFIYPEAYEFKQEKYHYFAQAMKQDKYELILIPIVEDNNESHDIDADNVLKSVVKANMNPKILLDRRSKMYSLLLDKVMDEHDVFLKSVGMNINRKDLTRWHPTFEVNSCKPIEKAELPTPPNIEVHHSATEVLESAKKMFNCNTQMEKALELSADSDMTSKLSQTNVTTIPESKNAMTVDTPPDTPKVQTKLNNPLLKGIPKSLLEKVRAKQAAKALEKMARPAYADKEIAMYAQLPSMAQLLHNIFVSEKKNVLTLEFVLEKLDNSYRTKMTLIELEKHVKLMSNLIPTWISVLTVRKINYVKLLKNVELATIVERFELFTKEKINSYQTTGR